MKNLAKPTTLKGTVSRYSGNGRKLGYPTANIASQTELEDGVYLGYGELGKYKSNPTLIFIGTPTTMGDTSRRVEAHFLDIADEDYYGEKISLRVLCFLRPNQTFGSVDELVAAIKKDEAIGRRWFLRQGKLATTTKAKHT